MGSIAGSKPVLISGQRLGESTVQLVDQSMRLVQLSTQLGLLAAVALLSTR